MSASPRDPLKGLLHRAGRLRLWSELLGAALWVGAGLIVLGLLIVGADAALGLSPAGLMAMDVLGLVAVTMAAVWLGWVAWRLRPRPAQVARLLEERAEISESRLINAWQLAHREAATISPPLRERAIALGWQTAQTVAATRVVDQDRLQRAAQISGAAALVLLGVWVFAPGVFSAVLPRLMQPTALHPPFTFVNFGVRIEPERVLFGDEAMVLVKLTGPTQPSRADLVFVDEHRQPVQRLAMQRRVADIWGASHDTHNDRARYFSLKFDRAERTRMFYIDTPEGRSGLHELTVHLVPKFERVHVHYTPPAYTGWPSHAERLDHGKLRALVGTDITLEAKSNLPLGNSELTLRGSHDDNTGDDIKAGDSAASARQIPLQPLPDDPRRATARFTIEHPGTFALSLRGVDGTPGDRVLRGAIEAVPDEKPSVRIDEQQQRTLAPEGWTINVRISVTDDIGLGRAMLYRAVNGRGLHTVTLPLEPVDDQNRRAEAHARFDLGQLGVQPGDRLAYYAVAYDNYPGGGQRAETDVYVIEVVSMEEYKAYQRTRYRIGDIAEEWFAFEQRLRELESKRASLFDELTSLTDRLKTDDPMSDAQRRRIQTLMDQIDSYRSESQNLFFDMRDRAERATLYEFENMYKDRLSRIGAGLQGQASHADQVRGALGRMMSQTLPGDTVAGALRQHMTEAVAALKAQRQPFDTENRQQRERTRAELEALRWADELMAQGERIRVVAMEQQEIADRLAPYGSQEQFSAADQLRANELADRQAVLRDDLADAMRGLREAADAATPVLPRMSSGAKALLDQAESLRILEDQVAAVRLATTGEGREAHQAARRAAQKLDSLLSDVRQMSGQANEDLDGCFSLPRPQLQQSLSQMAAARGVAALGMGSQGGSGYGMSGTMAQVGIVGPASEGYEGNSESDRQGGAGPGTGTGQGRGTEVDRAGAERLQPDQTERRQGAQAMPGVPQIYRQAVEAYFKRLAEESP